MLGAWEAYSTSSTANGKPPKQTTRKSIDLQLTSIQYADYLEKKGGTVGHSNVQVTPATRAVPSPGTSSNNANLSDSDSDDDIKNLLG